MSNFHIVDSSSSLPYGQAVVDFFSQRPDLLPDTNSLVFERVVSGANDLGLALPLETARVIAALGNPIDLEEFLGSLPYQVDPITFYPRLICPSPEEVLRLGSANCFSGAMFAHAVLELNQVPNEVRLLETSGSCDHNIVVFQEEKSGRFGTLGKSGSFEGTPLSTFDSPIAAALAYQQTYGERLVAVSDPVDLDQYGPDWMAQLDPLLDIYQGYVDSRLLLTDVKTGARRPHEVIRALENGWIIQDPDSHLVTVNYHALRLAAQKSWEKYHQTLRQLEKPVERCEWEFEQETGGITIPALMAMVRDFNNTMTPDFNISKLVI